MIERQCTNTHMHREQVNCLRIAYINHFLVAGMFECASVSVDRPTLERGAFVLISVGCVCDVDAWAWQ